MSKKIVVNLPVSDLAISTAFYEALGFVKDVTCSDQNASALRWSDNVWVMLLTHDFYQQFMRGKKLADTRTTNGVILALEMETKEAVQQFVETAQARGGKCSKVTTDVSEGAMLCYDIEDPDGHLWEPTWLAPSSNKN
jgi:predicted lactoylglutathione lyase